MSEMRIELRSRCPVYQLPAEYSHLLVSNTLQGLRLVIQRALMATGQFPTGATHGWAFGKIGTVEFHIMEAMSRARLVDMGHDGPWELLHALHILEPYVDAGTVRTLDDAIAYYLRAELLSETFHLFDAPPGCAEWFIDTDVALPRYPPPTTNIVTRLISRQAAEHFKVSEETLAVTIFDRHGEKAARASQGTFTIRRLPSASPQ